MINEEEKNKGCIDWNSPIEDDGLDKTVKLLDGDFDFSVIDFKKGYHNKTEVIDSCNMAILTLNVKDNEGNNVHVQTQLCLHKKMEWKISAFFRSIGKKKRGQVLIPDWDHVVGATGRAHFKPRSYKGKDGTEKQANNVSYYIDKEEEETMEDLDVIIDGTDEDDESIF